MTENTKYNGWTNRETWLVNLHLDDFFHDNAIDYYNEAEPCDIFDKKQAATHALSDYIKESLDGWLYEEGGAGELNSMLSDLLNTALARVNHYEIAESYIESLDLEGAA